MFSTHLHPPYRPSSPGRPLRSATNASHPPPRCREENECRFCHEGYSLKPWHSDYSLPGAQTAPACEPIIFAIVINGVTHRVRVAPGPDAERELRRAIAQLAGCDGQYHISFQVNLPGKSEPPLASARCHRKFRAAERNISLAAAPLRDGVPPCSSHASLLPCASACRAGDQLRVDGFESFSAVGHLAAVNAQQRAKQQQQQQPAPRLAAPPALASHPAPDCPPVSAGPSRARRQLLPSFEHQPVGAGLQAAAVRPSLPPLELPRAHRAQPAAGTPSGFDCELQRASALPVRGLW